MIIGTTIFIFKASAVGLDEIDSLCNDLDSRTGFIAIRDPFVLIDNPGNGNSGSLVKVFHSDIRHSLKTGDSDPSGLFLAG